MNFIVNLNCERSVKELLEEGTILGYRDAELRAWVESERKEDREKWKVKEDRERAERAAERDLRKLEYEAQIEASKAAAAASAATTGQTVQPVTNVINPPKVTYF